MSAIAHDLFTIVYSTVYSDAVQRKHQSSASLAFVRGIHRGPVNSSHKGPVARKMFPFDDVIVKSVYAITLSWHPVPRVLETGFCFCHKTINGKRTIIGENSGGNNEYLLIFHVIHHIDCFVQDCSDSIANSLQLLQSCIEPSIYWFSIASRHYFTVHKRRWEM